jgi:hypothetical protein
MKLKWLLRIVKLASGIGFLVLLFRMESANSAMLSASAAAPDSPEGVGITSNSVIYLPVVLKTFPSFP